MKRLASVISAALLLMQTFPAAFAADNAPAEEFSFTYIVNDGEVSVTGCTGSAADVKIPQEIDGLPVTSIAAGAFTENADMVSCTIPDSVKSIGSGAFDACMNLKSVSLGSGVSEIGKTAFIVCPELSEFTVSPENPTYSVIDGSLYENKDTLRIYAGGNDAKISPETKTVGTGAFLGKMNLTSVSIPESVEEIGYEAFSGCLALKEITIPDSVKVLGSQCFMSCTSLTGVTIGNSVREIPMNCFYSCTSLKKVILPDSLETVLPSAFYNCTALGSVYIPPSVKDIGSDALGKEYNTRSRSSERIPLFTIRGEKNSAAEKYAYGNGISFETGRYRTGDVNADGFVDAVDASEILFHYTLISSGQKSELTGEQLARADFDGDGKADSSDASAVLAEYARTQTL